MKALRVLFAVMVFAATETYVDVKIDAAGQLQITTSDKKTIAPKKNRDQVGFEMPAVAPDRNSVGWLALYPNANTSYPIPLELVVHFNGRVRSFRGVGLPVWRWKFEAGGKQVAFKQETTHGGLGTHYELREIASGRLVAQYEPRRDAQIPPWVMRLESN